ncbi:MAG: preprotein translocase subunit SecE [Candidatus Eiseniibacteriota bacterium]|jgi:preprotein translocase subunit SecE
MSLVQNAMGFLKEVQVEMTKVSWPSRKDLRDSTIVVIVMTIIMSFIVWVLDMTFNLGLRQLFRVA